MAAKGTSVTSMGHNPRSAKKTRLGGPMTQDEIKMNRHILKEISQMKKNYGSRYSSPQSTSKKDVDSKA